MVEIWYHEVLNWIYLWCLMWHFPSTPSSLLWIAISHPVDHYVVSLPSGSCCNTIVAISFCSLLNSFLSCVVSLGSSIMQCSGIQCNVMQFNPVECNANYAMQCNTMQCNAMQCNAMQCNAMQYNTMPCNGNPMQCNPMQCYVWEPMRCAATRYNAFDGLHWKLLNARQNDIHY